MDHNNEYYDNIKNVSKDPSPTQSLNGAFPWPAPVYMPLLYPSPSLASHSMPPNSPSTAHISAKSSMPPGSPNGCRAQGHRGGYPARGRRGRALFWLVAVGGAKGDELSWMKEGRN